MGPRLILILKGFYFLGFVEDIPGGARRCVSFIGGSILAWPTH
jgi:hypothetical protein